MLSASSMSRIVGPIIILTTYTAFGTAWTFGSIAVVMILPMILLYTLRTNFIDDNAKTESIKMTNENSKPVNK